MSWFVKHRVVQQASTNSQMALHVTPTNRHRPSALHLNHDILRLGLLLHLRPQDLLQVDKAPWSGSIWHRSPHVRLRMQFSFLYNNPGKCIRFARPLSVGHHRLQAEARTKWPTGSPSSPFRIGNQDASDRAERENLHREVAALGIDWFGLIW